MRALVSCQVMKTLVGILGQHQTGEQTRRLFCLRNLLVRRALATASMLCSRPTVVFLEAFDLANRLEVHLAIGRGQIWEFTR